MPRTKTKGIRLFSYFGSKHPVAHAISIGLAGTQRYVEPTCGSAAVFLNADYRWPKEERLNDIDGLLVNVFRAIQKDPDTVARCADVLYSQTEQFAAHHYLRSVGPALLDNLRADPHWFDAEAAGYWIFGQNSWIATGWCSGVYNPRMTSLSKQPHDTKRTLYNKTDVTWTMNEKGQIQNDHLWDQIRRASARLSDAIITCTDWYRVLAPSITERGDSCSIFLDPPYEQPKEVRDAVYHQYDESIARQQHDWAMERGDHERFKIAYCTYDGFFEFPRGWQKMYWTRNSGTGFSNTRDRSREGYVEPERKQEVIWFSPHCFGGAETKIGSFTIQKAEE